MNQKKTINVLFLCTGNSARSVLCEAMLNHLSDCRFRGFSAGSQPKGEVHPMTLKTLAKHDISTADCRSKSWDEYSHESSPAMDIVVTVCDNAAAEVCPIWPSAPIKAHWSIPDPATVEGKIDEQEKAFEQAWRTVRCAVSDLKDIVLDDSNAATLVDRLNGIKIRSI